MGSLFVLVVGAVALFVAMLGGFSIGHKVGRRGVEDEDKARGIGAIEGAVFALFGLVLAFAFSASWERLEARRHLVIEEATSISKAYMRLDLLQPDHAKTLRAEFRGYLDARLLMYNSAHDEDSLVEAQKRASEYEDQIWKSLMSHDRTMEANLLVIPAVNEMFDTGTARSVALRTHTPWLITAFLVLLALLSSVLAGRALAGPRDGWFHRVLFSSVVAVTIYVVTDLDHPRTGLIRVGAADDAMMEIHGRMEAADPK